jgi:hypothetical protein
MISVKKALRPIVSKLRSITGALEVQSMHASMRKLAEIFVEDYINKHMYENPRYQNPKRLNRFEYQVYSQNGEDGIIAEIFKRIGTTNRVFVEFGVGDGLQNNTAYLLLKNWIGFWIEANPKFVKHINEKYSKCNS